MKNKETPQKTFGMQFRGMLYTHIKSVLLIFFVGFCLLSGLWMINILDTILGCLMLFIYGVTLFSEGYSCATYDLKSYTNTKAYPHKGIILSLLIPVSNFLIWILMKYMWSFNPSETINQIPTFIGNIIFVLWTFPYNSFMKLNASHISVIGHILLYIFPVITVGAGYFAGFKKWDIASKFSFLMYEKKKKQL